MLPAMHTRMKTPIVHLNGSELVILIIVRPNLIARKPRIKKRTARLAEAIQVITDGPNLCLKELFIISKELQGQHIARFEFKPPRVIPG